MAEPLASDPVLSGADANKTFERTLKSLDDKRIPPEFQEDFEDYISSGDHGSSTHRDKVGRSSDLSHSGSDESSSINDSGSEYQPELGNTYQNHGLDPQALDPRYTPGHAGISLRDVELNEDQDDFSKDLEDVDMNIEEEEDEVEKGSKEPAKRRGKARGKKMTAKPVGFIRYQEENELEWFDPNNDVWRPAVFHQDIREQLIKDAARLGRYRMLSRCSHEVIKAKKQAGHHLACGKDKLDVTAFHPAYAENGPEREHWPKILFQYAPTVSDFLHTKPPIWQLHDGRVVIDCNNDAMSDYHEIPVTLARNADSWLMLTCMRKNNHITIQDFRGRMPGGRKMSMADPLGRNRISMNMTRFRKFGCCLTWNSIRNVDTQREYLDKKLPRRCIRLNSTESFRKLYPWEVAESELQDAGKFLKRTRARQKDISRARSHQVFKRKKSEFEQLKKNFDRLHPKGLDDYDTEDEEYARKPVLPLTDHTHTGAEPTGENAHAQFVKPGRRKRVGSLPRKDIRVLPGDSSPNSPSDVTARPICPRRHKEYAGFLSRAPNNAREAQLLYDLLQPTRIHFEMNTKQVAPETYGDECYKCQFSDLQNAMIDWHEAQVDSYERFKEMLPAKLIGLQYVENGELYWNTNWRNVWFGPQPMVSPDEIF
ncbi:MAG: hypothetical protein LQ337_002762 [Flavoplaca oasis]|nr:MAG: hypothetical protein LQ337_002762 [Flavoplaca oasis]